MISTIPMQEAEKSAKRQISDDAVIAQPPVFMEQLKEVGVVAEGQNVLLEARIEPKNDSNLRVEWELNGKPVKPGITTFLETFGPRNLRTWYSTL